MLTFQITGVCVGMLLFLFEAIQWRRKTKRSHLIKAFVWLCFALAIWQPGLLQWLADKANIGRGADFLLYNLAVFSLLSSFYFLRKLEEQRQQITHLVREMALRDVSQPEEQSESTT